MKKILITLLCILTLSACTPKVTPTPNQEQKQEPIKEVAKNNPWDEFNNIPETINKFKRDIKLPESLLDNPFILSRVIPEQYVDLYYGKDLNEISISLRIQPLSISQEGASEIKYDYSYNEEFKDLNLEVYGIDKSEIVIAKWYDDEYNYQLFLKEGMDIDKIQEIIKEFQ